MMSDNITKRSAKRPRSLLAPRSYAIYFSQLFLDKYIDNLKLKFKDNGLANFGILL